MALFDKAWAVRTGGQFVVRIEDTDRNRLVAGSEQQVYDSLRWLSLEADESPEVGGPYAPYRQSERLETYRPYVDQLIEAGHAYYCWCSSERLAQMRAEQQASKQADTGYDRLCLGLTRDERAELPGFSETPVVRMLIPADVELSFNDLVRGEVRAPMPDDQVILKADGYPTYHLAVVVDDHLMQITHVIRGSEWLPTFPLHALILRAFGWEEPVFVHLSVFLKPSGKGKMSKREAADLTKDGYSIFVKDLEGLGYLPAGVINWIALMGWSYDGQTEFFTLPDLVEKFSLEKLNPSPAAINFTKLDHFNGLHIRDLQTDDLAHLLVPVFRSRGVDADVETLQQIAPIIQERLVTLDDALDFATFFFQPEVSPAPEDLVAKGMSAEESAQVASRALELLEELPDVRLHTTEPRFRALVEELGLNPGQVFGIMRVAITGQKVSPPLFESMEIIGREKVLARMRRALEMLSVS